MRTILSLLALALGALGPGCASRSPGMLGKNCHILAVFREPPLDQSFREDWPLPFWSATALVVSNGKKLGALCPATLLLAAAPDEEAMTAESLLYRTRLAVDCRDALLGGRWLIEVNTGTSVFVLVYSCGGTAGLRVQGFRHSATYENDAVQDHVFHKILDEDSRLPVYVGDFDGDGAKELFVASLAANMSAAPITPCTYRVFAIDGGSPKVIAEVDEAVVLALKDLEPL